MATVNEKLTTIADAIRAKTGGTDALSLDGMATAIVSIETGGGGGGGTSFTTDETLTLKNGVLSVNTADTAEKDNTLPITSSAVYTTVGNINALLETI